MDEAARARSVSREAIEDVTPARLREAMDDRLATCSTIPGVLALLGARVADGSPEPAGVERRAAGVQLIYEGLGLTRTLVRGESWPPDAPPNTRADLDVLAADVLVSRGFRLLARTEAAGKAVETVKEFGREQSGVYAGPDGATHGLEANCFELAVVAGASAAGGEPPVALRQYVVGLAHSLGDPPLPTAVDGLPETVEEVMGRVSAGPPADETVRPSSATDP